MSKGKYLGLDFGDRRVGVAITDEDKAIVFPRTHIDYDQPEDLLVALTTLCAEERVERVIIGLPIQMDGSMGDRVEKTYLFARDLKQALGDSTAVECFDERLTTRMAEKRLQEQGIKSHHQKGHKDSLSAQLILEMYLIR